MQSVGAHQTTDDGEFEAKVLAFQQLVRDMERVHEAILLWSDCMDAMAMAGAGLGDTMSKFFAANSTPSRRSDLDTSSKAYLSVQADINETLRASVRKSLMERCLRPITEVLAVAPMINEKVAVRKQLRLDSEFYSSKYKKISAGKDETDPEVTRVATKMRDAEKALSAVHEELIASFDEIEEARSSMLIPEVSALIGCQFFFQQTSTQMMSEVISFFPQSASTMCALHAESAAAPYVSRRVVQNLKSTPGPIKANLPMAVHITDITSDTPSAHHASSHKSLISARQPEDPRPRSDMPVTVSAMDATDKSRSVPLTTSPPPMKAPPPTSAPRGPPPKPVKKAPGTNSAPGNISYGVVRVAWPASSSQPSSLYIRTCPCADAILFIHIDIDYITIKICV